MLTSGVEMPGFMRTPYLVVPLDVWRKIMTYARLCKYEINGLGYIDRINADGQIDKRGDDFYLSEVFILDQVVSGGSAEIDEATMHAHIHKMVTEREDTGRLRFQWHSHVNMTARFSSVDTATINKYDADWIISLVVNKRGELEARLDVYRPFWVWSPVTVSVATPNDSAITDACVREIQSHVKIDRLLWTGRVRENDLDTIGDVLPIDPSTTLLCGEVNHES